MACAGPPSFGSSCADPKSPNGCRLWRYGEPLSRCFLEPSMPAKSSAPEIPVAQLALPGDVGHLALGQPGLRWSAEFRFLTRRA